ncbi:MAG: indolepyruvate ferredoxin oxidoreductase [Gammaproteobacteria bacterium]|jgi:indolepyruvate ferredoxin oxidoreductase
MVAKKISLDDKYVLDVTRAYMTGIEALVRLPMLQHQRDRVNGLNTAGFISGYRGSPLGGVDKAMWKAKKHLDGHNIHFQPGINEDLAATAVWGSQQVNLFEGARYDGVFGMWYGKGPGVDRSMDVLKHANSAGTSKFGGVLAVAGDDHACKSSTLPHQSEHMFIGASIPVLSPCNVQEVLDLGIYGWELSRYCGCWVALKAITENMDSAISAKIDPGRIKIVIPENFEMPVDGVHIRWPDNPLEQELRLNKYKIYAAREFARVNHLNRIVVDSNRPRLGIITTGKAYLDVMQALEDLGIDSDKAGDIGLRVFKVGMVWPLEPVATHLFAKGLEEILVVEEKRSVLEDQLTGQLYNWPVNGRPRVIGEFDEHGDDLLTNLGELTPAMVARAIAARMKRFYWDENIEKRLKFYDQKERSLAQPRTKLVRKPHYCSGCPHNSSTRLPEGSRAYGGIGCHYMGIWEKGDRLAETYTQMGGEGVNWVGQAAFTDTKHVFQNMGDGTYFHSGLLAIRQALAAGVNITYKILYNDAVAMTGGQPVDGELSVALMVMQLRGEGVKRIALISDFPDKYGEDIPRFDGLTIDHRDRLITVEKALRETEGTSVLIYDQTCAAEKRRRRKNGTMVDPDRRVIINTAVCEGCGDCSVQSNCLSVIPLETELGRKRQIDQSSCNKDFSCLSGFCPSFVTVVGGNLRKKKISDNADAFPELPEPRIAPIDDQPWNIVVTGIGGTGVLTISSLVSMAAHIEGKGCATLNQTGLAQKFGAVVSHVRVGLDQSSINAVRIPAGDADLLLGCDLVVAADNEAMTKVNAERSFAIVNDFESTTAEFVSNPDITFPADAMKQTIIEEVGNDNVSFVNATSIATHLLGDTIATNLFLLGFAYQKGKVPVSAEALEQAIELNAVEIEMNKKAFLWGRRAAFDLAKVTELIQVEKPIQKLDRLEDIVANRFEHLLNYQNRAYAERYETLVTKVKQLEDQKDFDQSYVLTKSVARNLYKLMAFKDEYEVARLYSNGEFKRQIQSQFEGNYRLEFHLAAPFLAKTSADTGLAQKRQFPQFMLVIFGWLERFKGLRGTFFDPFARTAERKLERQLIVDYEAMIDELVESASSANYAVATELASLPEQIRGYGHIKEQHLEAVSVRKDQLLNHLRKKQTETVQIDFPLFNQ